MPIVVVVILSHFGTIYCASSYWNDLGSSIPWPRHVASGIYQTESPGASTSGTIPPQAHTGKQPTLLPSAKDYLKAKVEQVEHLTRLA